MWKYLVAVLKIGWLVLLKYPKMVYYSKHVDKVPYEKRKKLGMRLYRKVATIFRVHVNMEGRENIPEGKVMFVSNHQSFYDPIMTSELGPGFEDKRIFFIAKKEIKKFPFAGRVSTFLESIYIDREDARAALDVIKKSAEKYEDGYTVWVFPEGTRSKHEDHHMNEFKPGTFKLAFKTKATIVPCAFCGTWEVLSKHINKKKYEINFKVFDPISYEEYKDLTTTELSDRIYLLINTWVNEHLKKYLPS